MRLVSVFLYELVFVHKGTDMWKRETDRHWHLQLSYQTDKQTFNYINGSGLSYPIDAEIHNNGF